MNKLIEKFNHLKRKRFLFLLILASVMFNFFNIILINQRIDSINDEFDSLNTEIRNKLEDHSSRLNVLEMDDNVEKEYKKDAKGI